MESYRRKVAGIVDGDTFRLYTSLHGSRKIRLAGVDLPRGPKAAAILRRMIGGKTVTIKPVGRSYDRVVAEVIADGKNVNKRLKRMGY